MKSYAWLLLVGVVGLVGCDSGKSDSASSSKGEAAGTVVSMDGSSTVYPIAEVLAEEFKASSGKDISVGRSGTGTGFKKFFGGEVDIANASRPISAEEQAKSKETGIDYIELPVCFDAITIVVHKDNDWIDTISIEDLKKMWEPDAQQKITNWNQVNPAWPDHKLALYGAGSDSGTFDYFTEVVCGKAKASRGDYTSSEDDNTLVQGVSGNKYALGYVPFSYYVENKETLKALSVTPAGGSAAVLPSQATIVDGTYRPFSRPLFIYVNSKSAADKPEVKEYVDFCLANVGRLAATSNFVALPDSVYEYGKNRFKASTTGSVFAGDHTAGKSIEEIVAGAASPQ